jgi:hypothetical protein
MSMMNRFREFDPSPGWEELDCEAPGCDEEIEYCIGHQQVIDDSRDSYYIMYTCKDHAKEYAQKMRETRREDGIRTRIFSKKLK